MISKFMQRYYYKKYINNGLVFGSNLSYSYMGEWVGYERDKKKFQILQRKIKEIIDRAKNCS